MAENKNDKVNQFLQGYDPMEHIVNIECGYDDDKVSIIYNNEKGQKRVKLVDFKPFVWAKNSVAVRMFDGDRKALKNAMFEYGIGVKALTVSNDGKNASDRLNNGYKLIFYAKNKMSFQRFQMFFNSAKTPIYENKKKKTNEPTISNREFLAVSPVEQYMIASGRRMFKGYDNYDDVKRLLFDLETQGLNPEIHAIDQIGIRTNKGFEKIISIEGEGEKRKENELNAIIQFLHILYDEKPDVIAGHNSENFDWNFIIVRCQVLGTSLEELSQEFFKHPIYKKKKETVLKLGGEVEYFKPTIMWGHTILDSLHAVRRAQAIDSNMKLANLKYVTRYLDLKKENRVYVPGGQIGTIWLDTNEQSYAFNNQNGDWYKITETHKLLDNYQYVSGKYIVERYLLDDIWETDKVELALNEANFLICKMLPTTFQRACTMGTAGIWKLIMLAWCYENGLAIPAFGESKRFTGGLSRLLKTGYADRVVKLDYNSLYPSIMLTWNITNPLDISDAMLTMLEYVLTNRELYKDLKGSFGKKAKAIKKQLADFNGSEEEKHQLKLQMQEYQGEASKNDKKQLPLKILGNSMFGSFGAPNVFPFGNNVAAEKVTCIGRQSLRLMIYHFTNLGYTPIVGDSFTPDTPLFIRYCDENDETSFGCIDIKPISELICVKHIDVDALGREYDKTQKKFQVLCRSGWSDVSYIYRHKTNKDIYEVKEENAKIHVTEDHSLFDEEQKQIKPNDITESTKLEYYTDGVTSDKMKGYISEKQAKILGKLMNNKQLTRMPIEVLNGSEDVKTAFLAEIKRNFVAPSKTCLAQLLYLGFKPYKPIKKKSVKK